MPVKSYRELIAWQKAVGLVTEVYRVTEVFPQREIYGLSAQMRRAAVSIPSNIAEGQGRSSTGEFKHFVGMARGSLFELETQLIVAMNLGYLAKADAERLELLTTELRRILSGLTKSLK